MEMNDDKLKSLLQDAMNWEVDQMMEKVNSDPDIKDRTAPGEIWDKLYEQIHGNEENKEQSGDGLSAEEQELIRLGKIYKKKRARNKYVVLVAAVLCALGVGTISFGGPEKVFTEVKRMLSGREQTVVNTGDEDKVKAREFLSEENAYEKINEQFGFYPVKMGYLPEGMEFVECIIEVEAQNTRLYYDRKDGATISYSIVTNYRDGSTSIDVEDDFVREYKKIVDRTVINLYEYLVKDNHYTRVMVNFNHGTAQYSMVLTGIKEEEVEKIVENLIFS